MDLVWAVVLKQSTKCLFKIQILCVCVCVCVNYQNCIQDLFVLICRELRVCHFGSFLAKGLHDRGAQGVCRFRCYFNYFLICKYLIYFS